MKILNWLCPKPKSLYTIEMFRNDVGKWHWRLRHQNGNVLAHSEEYSDMSACKQTAENLATAAKFNLVTES